MNIALIERLCLNIALNRCDDKNIRTFSPIAINPDLQLLSLALMSGRAFDISSLNAKLVDATTPSNSRLFSSLTMYAVIPSIHGMANCSIIKR